ncbi:dihydroneopterin aldolase [uncultured Winogradskyella sp.]|uniref:dihydroneopterin aldolase n=1 Tax=uncultured Winogradskyella sp. TaxID=395353 RepID=UPI0030DAE578|tara:strand:+ start:183041 stop:183412 length:372 start_codon:yes stop_codon:yes gene_type:complete
MGIIKVENIRVFANHGCLKEETLIGSDYRVDLKVKANLSASSISDELVDTVDYVFLNNIVREEMDKPSKLLETVAQRIIDRIFNEDKMVTKTSVWVSKINPPIGGDVEMVTIKLSQKRKSLSK